MLDGIPATCEKAKYYGSADSGFLGTPSCEAIAEAQSKGLTVLIPTWNELYVDIDDDSGVLWFQKNIKLIEDLVGVESIEWKPSQTEGHHHVTVKLRQPIGNNIERIALQCILGSDLRREAFSYSHWRRDDPTPTIFFEKKAL